MTLLSCRGWRCDRLISAWSPLGPTDYTLDNTDKFAITYTICLECHVTFCDACELPATPVSCRECGGRLTDGAVWESVRAHPLAPAVERYQQGEGSLLDGNLPQALEHFDAALELRPGYLAAQYGRGQALFWLVRLDAAAEQLRRVVASAPDRAAAWYDLGRTLSEQGQTDEAMNCLQRAVSLEPGYPDAWAELARIHVNLGDDDGAVTGADRALLPPTRGAMTRTVEAELGEAVTLAHVVRAAALLNLGRDTEALADIDTAIDRGPDHSANYLLRADILEELGRAEEAGLARRVAEQLERFGQA